MIILSCWRFWKKISLNSWFPSFFRSDCTIQEAFLPAADVVSFGALSDALGRAQQWELVLEILQVCWLNGFNEQMLNGASYYDLFWYMIDIWLIYYWYMIDILWYISRVPFGCKQLQKKVVSCDLFGERGKNSNSDGPVCRNLLAFRRSAALSLLRPVAWRHVQDSDFQIITLTHRIISIHIIL